MAQYNTNASGWTPVNHADAATALANNSYQALRTTTATNMARVVEVFIGGEATSSTVNRMAYRRCSTNAGTPVAVTPAPLSAMTAVASVAAGYVTATTGPTIANLANGHLLNLAFNAFGGVIRWVAAPGEEIYNMGTTANNSESVLDSISGTGLVSTHLIFEEI